MTQAIAELVAERERVTGAPDPGADFFQLELDAEQRFRALERDEDAVRNRIRVAADFWCAQWFWPADPEVFEAFEADPAIRVSPAAWRRRFPTRSWPTCSMRRDQSPSRSKR